MSNNILDATATRVPTNKLNSGQWATHHAVIAASTPAVDSLGLMEFPLNRRVRTRVLGVGGRVGTRIRHHPDSTARLLLPIIKWRVLSKYDIPESGVFVVAASVSDKSSGCYLLRHRLFLFRHSSPLQLAWRAAAHVSFSTGAFASNSPKSLAVSHTGDPF